MGDRLPPQNLEAERSVLGGILLDNAVLHEVAGRLAPEDFYRDAHQTAYRRILDLYGRNVAIDAVSLADELERRGEFRQVGGDEFLRAIADSVPHAANARFHAEIVRQKSITRQLIQSATEIIRDGYSNLHTADELLASAERKLFAIQDGHVGGGTLDGQALYQRFSRLIQEREDGEVAGLDTGFDDLDDVLMGMRPKQFLVLGARPSTGKTSIGLQIAWDVAHRQQIPTLFVSLEMTWEELCERIVALDAGINTQRLRDANTLEGIAANPGDRTRFSATMTHLAASRLYVDDTPSQSLMQIGANARRLKMRDRLGFMVVDYLQYIGEKRANKSETTNDVLERVSKGVKALAKELGIPILCLAQLNRESEKDQRRPRLSDLRSSGAIEQDADVVMLLHSHLGVQDRVGTVDVIVAKNRNGPTGEVPLTFEREFTRFSARSLDGQLRAEPDRPNGRPIGYEDEDGNFVETGRAPY